MTLAACITQYESWAITGVTIPDVDELPDNPPVVHMPMLLLNLSNRAGSGEPLGFDVDQFEARVRPWLLMLIRPIGMGEGVGRNYTDIVTYYDLLMVEIAADPDLNGNLRRGMRVLESVMPKVVWSNQEYVGFGVQLEWVVKYS
jgi:hypothetical protein